MSIPEIQRPQLIGKPRTKPKPVDPDAIGLEYEPVPKNLIKSDEELAKLGDDELEAYVRRVRRLLSQWLPTPRQQVMFEACDMCDRVLFGGAAGGGKTEGALLLLYRKAQKIPGSRWLYIRNSFPELRRSVITRSRVRFDENIATWKAADKEWVFKNSSVIEMGYVENEQDVYQY